MKRILIGGLILIILIAGGIWFKTYLTWRESNVGKATSEFIKYTGDVIGTKNGTTTTFVGFYGAHTATSTYISKIGAASTATYGLQVGNASSSADVQLSIFASNDDSCDTATTTTIYDVVTMSQINWFDAKPFLFNDNTAQTLTNGTSTLTWNTSNGGKTGRTLLLTNLAAQCLRLDVNASSTELRAELRLK